MKLGLVLQMSQKQRELDLMLYRLDTLEKRFDQIERAILTQKSENINSELLNIVLSLVRPHNHQSANKVAATPVPQSQIQHPTEPIPGSTFMFTRRKTVL